MLYIRCPSSSFSSLNIKHPSRRHLSSVIITTQRRVWEKNNFLVRLAFLLHRPSFGQSLTMAYRKRRTRTQDEKERRRFTERERTGQSKVDGLNSIPGGRAIIISSFRGKTSIRGDQRLLRDLGYITRAHPSRSNRSTLSPTNSTSSASFASSPLQSERPDTPVYKSPFSNGDEPLFQEKQVSVAPAKGKGPNLMLWRKEDLDFLAVAFCGDN